MATDDEDVNLGELFDTQCNAIDMKLIDLVKERPALFDIRVPQKDRTKAAKEALWEDISQALQKKIKPLAAEMRWKYLRENYIKARKKQSLKEELAKKTGMPLKNHKYNRKYAYRYYEQMLFLNDALDHQKMVTLGNATKVTNNKRLSRRNVDPLQHQQVVQANSESKVINDDAEESTSETHVLFDHQYEAIAIPIQHEVYKGDPVIPLHSSTIEVKSGSSLDSTVKNGCINYEQLFLNHLHKTTEKPSPIDGFLSRLGEGLKRLPYRERSKLELEFLSRLNEVEDELGLLN